MHYTHKQTFSGFMIKSKEVYSIPGILKQIKPCEVQLMHEILPHQSAVNIAVFLKPKSKMSLNKDFFFGLIQPTTAPQEVAYTCLS